MAEDVLVVQRHLRVPGSRLSNEANTLICRSGGVRSPIRFRPRDTLQHICAALVLWRLPGCRSCCLCDNFRSSPLSSNRVGKVHAGVVRLEGWNHIPAGYGATFETGSAPWWLRGWTKTPWIDRFSYPLLVRRGLGWLTAFPTMPGQDREEPAPGWRVRPVGHLPPGSWGPLESHSDE